MSFSLFSHTSSLLKLRVSPHTHTHFYSCTDDPLAARLMQFGRFPLQPCDRTPEMERKNTHTHTYSINQAYSTSQPTRINTATVICGNYILCGNERSNLSTFVQCICRCVSLTLNYVIKKKKKTCFLNSRPANRKSRHFKICS